MVQGITAGVHRQREGVVEAGGTAAPMVADLNKGARAVQRRRREGVVEAVGMEVPMVNACSMSTGVRAAQRSRRKLVIGRPAILFMVTVCFGLVMFARTTTGLVIVTQISVQTMAPAMAVEILEETMGATTTGGSPILVMEEGMTQIVMHIITEVYRLESSNWLRRRLRL
jgi:hypothetical protein